MMIAGSTAAPPADAEACAFAVLPLMLPILLLLLVEPPTFLWFLTVFVAAVILCNPIVALLRQSVAGSQRESQSVAPAGGMDVHTHQSQYRRTTQQMSWRGEKNSNKIEMQNNKKRNKNMPNGGDMFVFARECPHLSYRASPVDVSGGDQLQ